MKRIIALLVAFIITLALASCTESREGVKENASVEETPGISESPEKEEPEKTVPFKLDETPTIEKQVIFDEGGIKITALELDYSGFSGPSVRVNIENNSGHYISLKSKDSAVNGAMVGTNFTIDVSEGATEENGIVFSKADLEVYGITTLEDLEFGLLISNSLNWDTLADVSSIVIETNAPKTERILPEGFNKTVYDNGGIRISAKVVNKASELLGAKVYFCVENKTDKSITTHAREVKADTTAINPTFTETVNAGKYVISEMEFMDSELRLLRIEKAGELSMKFVISDPETKETLLETENITFSLEN